MNLKASIPDRRGTKFKISNFVPIIPYVAALLIMLPRIWSANFGLLDDAVTLRTVGFIHESGWGVWDLQTGRSRPVYWLYWVIAKAIAGDNPRIYYLLNTLILILTLWLIQHLILRVGGSNTHFLLASLVILSSIPAIESFYTISKSEPIQIVLVLLSFHGVLSLKKAKWKLQRPIAFSAIIIFTLLAALVKETTAILLPIAGLWLLSGYILRWTKESRQTLWIYAMGVMIAVGVFLLIRFSLVGVDTAEGYASGYEFTITRILSSTSRWGAWVLYTFPYLIPFFMVPFLQGGLWTKDRPRDALLFLLIWIAAWILSFLPWIFVASYYLFPATIGIGLFIATLLDPLVTGNFKIHKPFTKLVVVFGIILFVIVQSNSYAAARQQLLVDRVNWEMVDWMGNNLPESSRVYVELPQGNEYLLEIELHLRDRFGRDDLELLPLSKVTGGSPGTPLVNTYLLSPSIHNQVLLSPRLGVDEDEIGLLNSQVLLKGFGQVQLVTFNNAFTPLTLNTASGFCPLFQFSAKFESVSRLLPADSIGRYCAATPFINTKVFDYGWSIKQLTPGQ